MKLFYIILTAVSLVKLSEGYLCYECNSTYDLNCFDFSPKRSSYYKGAYCDTAETGSENCYAVEISDRKARRKFRGCKKAGICDEYENLEKANIHFRVLTCSECNEHYCNRSDSIHYFTRSFLFTLLLAVALSLFN